MKSIINLSNYEIRYRKARNKRISKKYLNTFGTEVDFPQKSLQFILTLITYKIVLCFYSLLNDITTDEMIVNLMISNDQ